MGIMYKGRERDRRGQTSNFDNLPIDVKNNFKKIKESIDIHFNKQIDVRVIGSYLEGYYDEFSNYNVVIDCDDEYLNKLEEEISLKYQIDVKIIFDEMKYSKLIIE